MVFDSLVVTNASKCLSYKECKAYSQIACPFQMSYEHSLNILMEKDTSGDNMCRKVIPWKTSLQSQQTSGERSFVCNICSKGFYRRSHLKEHIRIHTGEKPFKCSLQCLEHPTDVSIESLLVYQNSSDSRNSCSYCGKCFAGPSLLKQHIRVHTGERPFSCSVCRKAFNQLENLKVHMRVHTGERPFGCPACPKTFTTKGNLKIHSKVHTGERPFSCQLCSFTSIQLASLKRHMASKHPG